MGSYMSFMGKGLPSTQMLNFLTASLYRQFTEKEINTFDDFHIAILDILNNFNSALPGKHYDAPTRKEIEACFRKWKEAEQSGKKQVFMEFMKKSIQLSKLDNTTMMTGIATPPAAMAAKRAGESLPQLKLLKVVPDVIFVPSATVLALVSTKLSRRVFLGNIASYSNLT